jgi:uncharacterized protein YlaI
MAFCDNPKCRFKDCNGSAVKYIKREIPYAASAMTDPVDLYRPLCKNEEVTVLTNFFTDTCTDKPIRRMFCDECRPLVDAATNRLKYLRRTYPLVYRDYWNDHGDNLLLHFVQSEWFARENSKKKSPF